MKTDTRTFVTALLVWIATHWVDAFMTSAAFGLYPDRFTETNILFKVYGWEMAIMVMALYVLLIPTLGILAYELGTAQWQRAMIISALRLGSVGVIVYTLGFNLRAILA